jgi:hypothetical protein
MDCPRLTHDPETPGHLTLRCNAQAAGMMRQAQGAIRMLLRPQAARREQDSDGDAANQAAWAEHCAAERMQEALPGAAPPLESPSTSPPAATPNHPEAEVLPPEPDTARTAAEMYVQLYPHRAALIQRLGRVPEDASFGPPEPDVVRALITLDGVAA